MEGGEKGGERPILCTATYVQRGARGIPRPLPELRCRAVLLRLSSGGPVCTEEGEPVTSLAVARSPCWRQGGHSLLFTGGGVTIYSWTGYSILSLNRNQSKLEYIKGTLKKGQKFKRKSRARPRSGCARPPAAPGRRGPGSPRPRAR